MTLFQPLWPTRPDADELRRGWEEVSKARAIAGVTKRERSFIDAAAAFFDPARSDYWDRIGRWADATRALHEAFPDDIDAKAFLALALLATAPASGDLGHQAEAAGLLDQVLREDPLHPGAVHYLIHANDASGREHESLDVVHRYHEIAPRNPHALHMPTHIFVRLGEWKAVIDGNRLAADAALENPAGDRGQWVWDEFPHAIEYLVYAYLQTGDDASAKAAMDRLHRTGDLQPGLKTAFHLASIPSRYALERRDWAAAAKVDARADSSLGRDHFPWPEAIRWFARGMGALRTGDIAGGRSAEARIAELRAASERMNETLFARQIEVLRLEVAAWIAHTDGDAGAAVTLMRQAVDLEASTPKPSVTPAPTLPAAELLGDLLLELGRPADALAAYDLSLRSAPRRFNSLAGAARAAMRGGDEMRAREYYSALIEIAAPGSTRSELAEAIRATRR
jgi:tetratricopeptide (TPR) repeat protein